MGDPAGDPAGESAAVSLLKKSPVFVSLLYHILIIYNYIYIFSTSIIIHRCTYTIMYMHTHTPVILCVMCTIVYIMHVPTVPMPNGMDTPGGLHSEWFKANFEA